MNSILKIVLIAALSSVVFVNCAGTGKSLGKEEPAVRSLSSYESTLSRDIAQMLYPGFITIHDDLSTRYPNDTLSFITMEVLRFGGNVVSAPGYYTHLSISIRLASPAKDFFYNASQLSKRYLHEVLMLLGRDWENIFSPSLTGVIVDFSWKGSTMQHLQFILSNDDIQDYLNARINLQELADKNWIGGNYGTTGMQRIEINGLENTTL